MTVISNISDETQKKLRKQKILINKLRRHGTMLPEDTYAISDNDVKITYSQKISPKTVENLKEQYPHLSENDIKTLYSVESKPQTSGGKGGKSDIREKLTQFMPWQDLRNSLLDIVQDMDPHEKAVLLEMNKAHESSAFLSNTMTRLKQLPTNPTEVFNIADGFVRRIIKVAKQLEYFRNLDKDDQIALLKGSVVEIMMLRSAVNFDVKTETWNLSTLSCIKPTDRQSSTPSPASSENQSSDSSSFMPPAGLNIDQLRKAAMNGADLSTLRNMARQGSTEAQSSEYSEQMSASKQSSDSSPFMPQSGSGLNIDQLRKAAMNGADLSTLRNMARQGSVEAHSPEFSEQISASKSTDSSAVFPPGLNIEQMRKAAMNGADLSKLRNMARQGSIDAPSLEFSEQSTSKFDKSHVSEYKSNEDKDLDGLESLRNAAKAAGFDVDALRRAAMNGASFSQLSQMAHSTTEQSGQSTSSSPDGVNVKDEQESSSSASAASSSLSAEILKLGNSETKTMFLTYSKFIRSLMHTICGDLIVLKFLIMLSLFSPDRQGLEDRPLVDKCQEIYANCMKKYIEVRFPDTKNMFARCIMKLTDLRNVNEVHTKMLLKMQVEDIEPLLVEIFDLPQ